MHGGTRVGAELHLDHPRDECADAVLERDAAGRGRVERLGAERSPGLRIEQVDGEPDAVLGRLHAAREHERGAELLPCVLRALELRAPHLLCRHDADPIGASRGARELRRERVGQTLAERRRVAARAHDLERHDDEHLARRQRIDDAEPDGDRALAGGAVGLEVAQVVDDEDRGREGADGHRRDEREERHLDPLHEAGPGDGDEAASGGLWSTMRPFLFPLVVAVAVLWLTSWGWLWALGIALAVYLGLRWLASRGEGD